MELRIDNEKGIAYIKLSGIINEIKCLDAFELAVSDKRYRKGMGRIWDLRDADLSSIPSTSIPEIAQYACSFPAGINDVKVAFVAHGDVEFGLARMVQASSLGALEINVFRSMDEAEKWMTEP